MKRDEIVLLYKHYKQNKGRLAVIEIDIRDLERDIKATKYSDMPHSTEISNPTYNEATRRMKDTELISLRKQQQILTTKVEKANIGLEALEHDEKIIITEKFINKKQWWNIDTSELDIRLEPDTIRKKFNYILDKLDKIL